MSVAALADASEYFLISSTTTPKPFPESSATLASWAAFRAANLVSCAIAVIARDASMTSSRVHFSTCFRSCSFGMLLLLTSFYNVFELRISLMRLCFNGLGQRRNSCTGRHLKIRNVTAFVSASTSLMIVLLIC